jgi:hypothetical protein
MEEQAPDLQDIWDSLLSGQAKAVRAVFRMLDAAERQAVLAHLQRMATEEGWHEEQVASAQAALDALQGFAETE